MEANTLKSKFEQFFEEIRNHPQVQIFVINEQYKDISKPSVGMEIFEEQMNIKLTNEDKELYTIGRIELDWSRPSKEENFIQGGFYIEPFGNLYIYPSNGDFWWRDEVKKDEIEKNEFLKYTNPFQFDHNLAGYRGYSYILGIIDIKDYVWPAPVYCFHQGDIFKFEGTMHDYYEAMLASYAVTYWQYFYVEIPPNHPKLTEIIQVMDRNLRILQELFPQSDFSYHQNSLDKVKEY